MIRPDFGITSVYVLLLLGAVSPAAEPPVAKSRVRLILSPNAWAPEFRVVEVGGDESRGLSTGLVRPIFPNWRDHGRQIVFCSAAKGNTQIFAMDRPGGAAKNLTNTTTREEQPACSPDGTKVLFVSNRDGNWEIYVMNSDGAGAANLTRHPGFDSDCAWSPDGKQIAFASDRSGKGFHLMVMNADGSNPHNLIERNLGGMLYPAWSPDGQQIAFAGLVEPNVLRLYVANSDGAGMQELTTGPGMSAYPAWSPDGRYLAYVHFEKHPDQCPDGGRVMLIDLEEGTTTEFAPGAPRVVASRMAWQSEDE